MAGAVVSVVDDVAEGALADLSEVFWGAASDNAADPIVKDRPSIIELTFVILFRFLFPRCGAFSIALTIRYVRWS